MSRRSRVWLAVVLTAALALYVWRGFVSKLLFIAVLMGTDPFGGTPHPTDAALMAQFAAHRGEFDELRQMMQEDGGLQRVGPDFTRPADPASLGVAPARLARYRQLLATAGVAEGLLRQGGEIVFLASTRGLSVSGSGKGVAFGAGPDEAATLVEGDLDAAFARLADKRALLERPLEGSWRLWLDAR